jgi:hypothetical protein
MLDGVRSLFGENFYRQLPDESDYGSIIQAIGDLELLIDDEERDKFSVGPDLDKVLGRQESSIKPLASFKTRFALMTGNQYKDGKAGPRKSFTIRHCTISFTMDKPPSDGLFWAKIEMSPAGERHPQAWATEAQDQDPGARLAFRVYLKGPNDDSETWSIYALSSSWESCCQANSLVNAFEGDSFVDICKRPRRYIYIDERNRGLLEGHPQLRPFVRGAYTGNDMEITPAQGRLRGTKQKRNRTEPKLDANNRKRARMSADGNVPSYEGPDSKGNI